MLETKTPKRFALALLAATCLTPVTPAQAAPGDRLGPEFQVNTTTAGDQYASAVAMNAEGEFVVAWELWDKDADRSDILARRYNARGEPQGVEFRVNSTTEGRQMVAAIAMNADDAFVVVWDSYILGDAAMTGVFARRYNAAGEAQGLAFRINTAPSNPANRPSVAMDADGDFIVGWDGCVEAVPMTYECGVFVQRYTVAGEPQGGEVLVNTTTAGPQGNPNLATAANGDFVVVWEGAGPGDAQGIFAQLFDATGAPLGGEVRVNTLTDGYQHAPIVAMDADGDFVVAWTGPDGGGYCGGMDYGGGVFARRFDPAGKAQGGEFQVNTTTECGQNAYSMAMDADGDFVVTWRHYGGGYFHRRFDSTGRPQNADSASGGYVAMDADGDFVLVWPSHGQDGDGWGVFAQRFDGAERVAGDFDGDGKADLLWRNPATGQTVVWLMDGETRLEAGSIGAVPAAWDIAGTGDFNGDGKADVLWRNSITGNAIVWQMNGLEKAAAQSIGTVPVAWTVEQLRDTNGDGLSDIVWRNTETGATVVWRMSGFMKTAAESIGTVPSDWHLH